MDLFAANPQHNLLQQDGEFYDYGVILERQDADELLTLSRHAIAWQPDQVRYADKLIRTRRAIAWFGEATYHYSGTNKLPHQQWPPFLDALRLNIQAITHQRYNACLLNRYHHGGESLGWHSDNETSIIAGSAIASLSLGATRRFCFKHRRIPSLHADIMLQHGQLIVMQGTTQRYWLHSLPPMPEAGERINLTFRQMKAPTDYSF